LRFGGKRESLCGRFDRSDRLNGARIEGAQVRRQADAGAGESAEQQIIGRLLTERGKGTVVAAVGVGGGGIVV